MSKNSPEYIISEFFIMEFFSSDIFYLFFNKLYDTVNKIVPNLQFNILDF